MEGIETRIRGSRPDLKSRFRIFAGNFSLENPEAQLSARGSIAMLRADRNRRVLLCRESYKYITSGAFICA